MPTYRVTDPKTGKTVRLTGDSPPTEQELEQIFATVDGGTPEPASKSETVGSSSGANTMSGLDRLLGLLPTAGGAVGGIVGGIGGTVAGMGVGGVPGAVGGAALGGAFGEALRELAQYARGGQIPASSTDAATQIAKEGAIQGGAELVGAGVAKGAATGAKAVYRGYLKPALSARLLPKANEIVDAALAEGIPVSRGGQQTAQRVIGELRSEVDSILQKTKGTIDLHDVADKVRAFAKQRYYKPGADLSDYNAALNVAAKLDEHPSIANPFAPNTAAPVSLPAANEAKRALYTSVKETGFGNANVGAKKATEKFAGHELRTSLEAAAPKIAPLNARETRLIDVAKAVARGVEREANQNPLYGVKTLVSAGYGGEEYARKGDPAAAAAKALALRGLMHPAVASRMAIVASRLSQQLGIGAAQAARLAYYAVSEPEEKP